MDKTNAPHHRVVNFDKAVLKTKEKKYVNRSEQEGFSHCDL